MFSIKGILLNIAKFIEKHLCWSVFFKKLQLKACRFVKRETPAWVFSGKFYESFKNTFFYGTYSCDCF